MFWNEGVWGGRGGSLSTRTGPRPSPIHPGSERRLPAQPRRRGRGSSFASSCLLAGEQASARNSTRRRQEREDRTQKRRGAQKENRILRKRERSGQHGHHWKQLHKKHIVFKAPSAPESSEKTSQPGGSSLGTETPVAWPQETGGASRSKSPERARSRAGRCWLRLISSCWSETVLEGYGQVPGLPGFPGLALSLHLSVSIRLPHILLPFTWTADTPFPN